MNYGYFDDERREYVITRPDTPLPWINYLGSEAYFSLISNTAGGYSFYRDARLRRITRYRYNNAPLDTGGRCLYIRDDNQSDSAPPELLSNAEGASPGPGPRVHAGGRPAPSPSAATSVADENFWSPTWQPARRPLD